MDLAPKVFQVHISIFPKHFSVIDDEFLGAWSKNNKELRTKNQELRTSGFRKETFYGEGASIELFAIHVVCHPNEKVVKF